LRTLVLEALLDLCIRVDLSDYNTIDLCGTGGDGKMLSIYLASFAAGAGIPTKRVFVFYTASPAMKT
jgi:anthranilate phosphoribosyltransferase